MGYLIYRFNGKRRVFVDGRSDFYGAEFMERYARVIEAQPGWAEEFNRWGFTHALLTAEGPLVHALEASGLEGDLSRQDSGAAHGKAEDLTGHLPQPAPLRRAPLKSRQQSRPSPTRPSIRMSALLGEISHARAGLGESPRDWPGGGKPAPVI